VFTDYLAGVCLVSHLVRAQLRGCVLFIVVFRFRSSASLF
jgi:hypothetical protein